MVYECYCKMVTILRQLASILYKLYCTFWVVILTENWNVVLKDLSIERSGNDVNNARFEIKFKENWKIKCMSMFKEICLDLWKIIFNKCTMMLLFYTWSWNPFEI